MGEVGADLRLGQEVMGWDMVMMVVQNVSNVCLYIYKLRCQIFVIPGVVNFLYQDYAHTPRKQNFIYNSLYNKHAV